MVNLNLKSIFLAVLITFGFARQANAWSWGGLSSHRYGLGVACAVAAVGIAVAVWRKASRKKVTVQTQTDRSYICDIHQIECLNKDEIIMLLTNRIDELEYARDSAPSYEYLNGVYKSYCKSKDNVIGILQKRIKKLEGQIAAQKEIIDGIVS